MVQCLKISVEDQDVNLLSEQLVSSKQVLDVIRFFLGFVTNNNFEMLDILDYLQKLAMERGVKSRVFVM
jgi:hypothetical protein